MSKMPIGWIASNLGSVAKIEMGQSPPSVSYNDTGQGIPFFQGKSDFGPVSPRVTKWCTKPLKIGKTGDILISVRAPVGPTNLASEDCCIGRGLAAVRPTTAVLSPFMLAQMQWLQQVLLSKATGTTFDAISAHILQNLMVNIPPLPEQHRIVDKLEQLFSRLDSAMQSLNRAQALLSRYRQAVLKAAVTGELSHAWRQQHMHECEPASALLRRILAERRQQWESNELAKMVKKGKKPSDDKWKEKYQEPIKPDTKNLPELPEGWIWASLDQLLISLRNGISEKPEGENGTPILRISSVRPLQVDLADIRHLLGSDEDYAGFNLLPGDLLITRYNGSPEFVGVCGMITDEPGILVYPDKLIRARLVKGLCLPEFTQITLNTWHSRAFIQRHTRTTAGQSGISGGNLKRVPVPVAPLKEQEFIAATADGLLMGADMQRNYLERNFSNAKLIRQSILHTAFTGQLVSQDPNDEPASVLLERIRAERLQHGSTPSQTGRGRKPKKLST